jgi:hypothetical protein
VLAIGHAGLSQDLHFWLSNGLMTLFSFVVGFEPRREFGLGDAFDGEMVRIVQPGLMRVKHEALRRADGRALFSDPAREAPKNPLGVGRRRPQIWQSIHGFVARGQPSFASSP